MAPNVENSPDLLRKAAQNKTGHVRDRLNSVLSTLESSLAGRGRPWGDDKIGHRFYNGENGYGTGREHATKNVQNAATSFDNFEKGQVKSAGMLKTMDTGNAAGYR
ncbi:hypothetical protein [Nocardia brasiliensis]|uniref:hypothetical protein n=1 Tax=Nocardia brasiliensis TaxID=37326 RepID=UPI00366CAF36